MTNRVKFSSHDLIGKELNIEPPVENDSFFLRILDRIIPEKPKSCECEFIIRIPTYLYLRAAALVDFICEEYDLDFDLGTFIWILYRDFLGRAYKYNNLIELCNFINAMEDNEVKVIDYQGAIINRSKVPEGMTKIIITLTKKEALKGELVLSDLYEAFCISITLERLIEMHFIHFIREYKKGNLPNAVADIVKYCKRIFPND
ncbi:hypothetical protein [Bacillus massiliglaciei]|uniref:hypothetical protein n=1 Tax=Bacillus massiliglaciei TaxID=1816693 RepID=UPI000DA64069|nr:hypothetical protein [Bacillus massiliglaciei]